MRMSMTGPSVNGETGGRLTVLVLLGLVMLVPVATWTLLPYVPAGGELPPPHSGSRQFPASPLKFEAHALGEPAPHLPRIGNVEIVDFDGNGRSDILAADLARNRVVLHRQIGPMQWEEQTLARDLPDPGRVTPVDLNQNGRTDVLVAVLGDLNFSDDAIGRVVLLEQQADGTFESHVVLDDVRRVADVKAADLNGNGRLDLAVAVFGYARGEIYWLENLGGRQFKEHLLMAAPGGIDVVIDDFDDDGNLDIITVISQDDQEIWAFENLGDGEFQPRRLALTLNFDLGSGGLVKHDLNGNGRPDLLWPAGDDFEDIHAYPQPYHGIYWLENHGDWDFEVHHLGAFPGTYAVAAGDLNSNGHEDLVLVSMTNEFHQPGNPALVWLENDGEQNFTTWQIDDRIVNLITVMIGDVNGNGTLDVVTGGLNFMQEWPDDRMSGVKLWLNRGPEDAGQRPEAATSTEAP